MRPRIPDKYYPGIILSLSYSIIRIGSRRFAQEKLSLAAKTEDLLELLSDPLEAWDQDAFWQLAMSKFAARYDPEAAEQDGGRKMGTALRAAALWALRRDKGENVQLRRGSGRLRGVRSDGRGREGGASLAGSEIRRPHIERARPS